MVVEPVNPVERATFQFSRLTEAAVRSAAAVLLVPNKVARTSGPIVVIARSVEDPSFPVAAAIATAAKEQLIIMETQGNTLLEDGIRNLIDEFGPTIKPVVVRRMPSVDPSLFSSTMPGVKEQLVILVRGGHENLSRVALMRGVPVLLVEPG
jgi:hypothetical protein